MPIEAHVPTTLLAICSSSMWLRSCFLIFAISYTCLAWIFPTTSCPGLQETKDSSINTQQDKLYYTHKDVLICAFVQSGTFLYEPSRGWRLNVESKSSIRISVQQYRGRCARLHVLSLIIELLAELRHINAQRTQGLNRVTLLLSRKTTKRPLATIKYLSNRGPRLSGCRSYPEPYDSH